MTHLAETKTTPMYKRGVAITSIATIAIVQMYLKFRERHKQHETAKAKLQSRTITAQVVP